MSSTTLDTNLFKLSTISFPPNHPLHKTFNRNTLKLSYSCMPNVHCIVSGHNKTILNKQNTWPEMRDMRLPCTAAT